LEEDPSALAVVLTGEGDRAFAARADLSEIERATPEEAAFFSVLGRQVLGRVVAFPRPVIAAIDGYALGGGWATRGGPRRDPG
jgi:enoyl-CoA hydratase